MLASVRECQMLWWPVPCSHTSKLHFQDILHQIRVSCAFSLSPVARSSIGKPVQQKYCKPKFIDHIFCHNGVNFLHSKEPPVISEMEMARQSIKLFSGFTLDLILMIHICFLSIFMIFWCLVAFIFAYLSSSSIWA